MIAQDDNSPPRTFEPKAIMFDLLTGLLNSWALWEDCLDPGASASSGRQWRERYLEITFKQGLYTPYALLVHQAAQDVGLGATAPQKLLQNWRQLKPWPEVPAILAQLKETGIKLAVLTNCSKELGRQAVADLCEAIHDESGRSFAFDVVVTAEESGWYKPRKEAYTAGLKALRLGPEDVLFVAGSVGDVEGATKAGMQVVWNNHIGLIRQGDIRPRQEGQNLGEALNGTLPA